MYVIPLYIFFFGFYICNNKGKVVWGNSNLSNDNEIFEHLSYRYKKKVVMPFSLGCLGELGCLMLIS